MKKSFWFIALSIFPPAVASAQGMLPSNVIGIINDSDQKIEFYMHAPNKEWGQFFINPYGQAELPYSEVRIAIRTGGAQEDSYEIGDIPVPDVGLPLSGDIFGDYFVRDIFGGEKWKFCADLDRLIWVIDSVDGDVCQN